MVAGVEAGHAYIHTYKHFVWGKYVKMFTPSTTLLALGQKGHLLQEELKSIKSWIYQRSKQSPADKVITRPLYGTKAKRLKELPNLIQQATDEYRKTAKEEREYYERNKPFLGEYRYTPECDSRISYVADDIAEKKCELSADSPCEYCGYGDDLFEVYKMKDGNWVFCYRWSGCMSYGSDDGPDNIFVFVAKSEEDMVEHAMDAKQRCLYENETGPLDEDLERVQSLWWE